MKFEMGIRQATTVPMAKHHQKIDAQAQHKLPVKSIPTSISIASELNMIDIVNVKSNENVSDGLADSHIPLLQRQLWAAEMVQQRGNNYLLPRIASECSNKFMQRKTNNIKSSIIQCDCACNRNVEREEKCEQCRRQQPSTSNMLATKTHLNSPNKVFRQMEYLEQITGENAAPYLQAFDRSLGQLEQESQNGNQSEDIRTAVSVLRSLRTEGKVTVWHIAGGLYYASYHNQTGEIRLHNNWGTGRATNINTLLHEAIHALHGTQYPGIRRQYRTGINFGYSQGILLLKWKAWTEYWAYRRVAEFENIRRNNPQAQADPHETAMQEPDVKRSVRKVNDVTNEEFDPSRWQPPTRYRRPLMRQRHKRMIPVQRETELTMLQRATHTGYDHAGRYAIDDQECRFTYHQNWFFDFRTRQTTNERKAFMKTAKRQVEDVWSGKHLLLPEPSKSCPCSSKGISVVIIIHPLAQRRNGRGYTVVVSSGERRGWTNQPNRRIDLGPQHEQPVPHRETGSQRVIAHEFGHTIGLTDEYHGWAGFFKTEGAHDDASIMNVGDEVRSRHYQHFADIVNLELGDTCIYSPAGHRQPIYENPTSRWRTFPFSFDRSEFVMGLQYDRRLSNQAILGLTYPTLGLMSVWNPKDRSVQTGPTLGLRLNQIAHPLYVDVRSGLLFDPARPNSILDLRIPLSMELGIHKRGFQFGVSYNSIVDLLGSTGSTHLVGFNLGIELP